MNEVVPSHKDTKRSGRASLQSCYLVLRSQKEIDELQSSTKCLGHFVNFGLNSTTNTPPSIPYSMLQYFEINT